MKKKIVGIVILGIVFVIFITKVNVGKEMLTGVVLENIEALAQTENAGKYNVMHFDCFDIKGLRTGKCTGASFEGPNGHRAYHSHTCSYCCQ